MRALLLLIGATACFGQTVTLRNHANSRVGCFEGAACTNSISISSGDTTGSFTVYAAHDLVVFPVWCREDCAVSLISIDSTPAVSIASGDIKQTSVQGVRTAAYGQLRFFYIDNAPSYLVGTHTLTLTVSDGHAPIGDQGVNLQIAYLDFSISSGYHFEHHLDSTYSSGTGATVNAPSITAPGDLMVFFEAPDGHTNSINSPWTATTWLPDDFESMTNSSNGAGYILNASAGAKAVNASVQYGIPSWGSLITTFTPAVDGTPSHSSKHVGGKTQGGKQ